MNPFAGLVEPLVRRPGDYERPPRKPKRIKGPSRTVWPRESNPWGLSGMQCEVLRRMSQGDTAKQIADDIERSVKTVETMFGRAKVKMEARNRVHACVLWDRHCGQRGLT